MQQNERIELIKAAVELTKITTANKVNECVAVAATFEIVYDLLKRKLLELPSND
jgi:hypothetical protein